MENQENELGTHDRLQPAGPGLLRPEWCHEATARPPPVSVVIPSHNRAAMLRRAIESVLAQTFADFELIVVDDASTDNTAEVIQESGDPRVRVVQNAVREGAARARNKGIEAASGEWVAFLDSDDEWLPRRLELQVERLRGSAGATVGYCLLQEHNHVTHTVRQPLRTLHEGDVFDRLLKGNRPPTTSAFMVKRSALLDIGGFDESLPSGHDIDLWLRLAQKGNCFSAVNEVLVIWHRHAGPRVSKDPDALLGGYHRFRQRWGPVMRRRVGRRAYCRWKWRRSRWIQQVLSDRVREEMGKGNTLQGLRYAGRMLLPIVHIAASRLCLRAARLKTALTRRRGIGGH